MKTGTLFARCENADCSIFHKVVDNLNLFSELAGPVFSSPAPGAVPFAGVIGGFDRTA